MPRSGNVAERGMGVFRHNDVAEDVEDVATAYLLKGALEEVAGGWVAKVWLPAVTAECREMEVSVF